MKIAGCAFVALGSNLGDSRSNVGRSIDDLRQLSERPILVSSLWESAPVDCPPGSPMFVNAVVGLTSMAGETPESLLAKLQAMEKDAGRRPKKIFNEPRPLDLDLIAFGNEIRSTPQLILPHPRAHQRRFVLQPLNEIAPELVLPGQSKTVAQLLEELPLEPGVTKISQVF
jgi:2-amino-4-hydroxy-6-hydroxymethyldihydropteridine diphosphokinase